MNIKLKYGNFVQIISGDFKGLYGKIIFINKKRNFVLLDSLPKVNKFTINKKTFDIKVLIHISNIKLINNKDSV